MKIQKLSPIDMKRPHNPVDLLVTITAKINEIIDALNPQEVEIKEVLEEITEEEE